MTAQHTPRPSLDLGRPSGTQRFSVLGGRSLQAGKQFRSDRGALLGRQGQSLLQKGLRALRHETILAPMTDERGSRIGTVLSADIAVPDHERVLRFYSRVLGTGEHPLWREDLLNSQGTPIIGIGARSAEYAHLPAQWMPHIQVADVAASARRAIDLGGKELMHARADDGASQWAVLADPGGAAFGIIPAVSAADFAAAEAAVAAATSPVGTIRWLDLTVADADSIRDFYREVVGWSAQDVAMEHAGDRYADYNMLDGRGTPAAGVCHARGVNAGLPPVWMIYLPVGDLAESLRRVEEEGGTIVKTMKGKDGAYVYAAIRDPIGAHVALTPA